MSDYTPTATPPTHAALVTGDATIEWNFAHKISSADDGSSWDPQTSTTAGAEPGGAALLAKVLRAAIAKGNVTAPDGGTWEIHPPALSLAGIAPGDPLHHHSFAVWRPMKRNQGQGKPGWRVYQFLGLHKREPLTEPQSGESAIASPELLLIDDGALTFRHASPEWPAAVANVPETCWIVLKVASPVAEGRLWKEQLLPHARRLIAVVAVDQFRRSEVQISRDISWERTAQDLLWELTHNPRINSLSRCAHVVVSFGAAGALVLSRDQSDADNVGSARLIFDPTSREGSWEADQHGGGIVGGTICLTAAIAREAMRAPGNADIARGVRAGLSAIRRLHREGYPKRDDGPLEFPADAVVDAFDNEKDWAIHAEVSVQQPTPADGVSSLWTILDEKAKGKSLDVLAQEWVEEGPAKVLNGVPLGRFGKLLTMDRREIESLSSIQNLLREYCKLSRPERPLSIAVFGPPGAGKSFGVSEVASAVVSSIRELKFNLSQFSGPEALLDAFHQVRDVVLKGDIPLVFWDEFDTSLGSEELGWLRYFLAPMQDGNFQQGQITHPIGRAIFVFAGGTKATYAAFNKPDNEAKFKSVKGPDFVSRLKGYLDVLGPNESSDRYKVLRRAILLRSMLRRSAPHLFNVEIDPKEKTDSGGRLLIDSGVLRAFLTTRTYRHGARSMESLIAMSSLSGKRRYERSSLPAEEQLDLHVDARDFLSIMHRLEWMLTSTDLDRLARMNHEEFRTRMEELGYRHGGKNDDDAKTHTSLVEWEDLPEDEKEQNRGTVRDIPNKLAAAGFIMLPARAGEGNEFAPAQTIVDRLAEIEHDRWVKAKLEAGWSHAPQTDKPKKLHADLLAWTELSAEERAKRYGQGADRVGVVALSGPAKKKDEAIVLAIPKILASVGYTVVRDGTIQNVEQGAAPPAGSPQ